MSDLDLQRNTVFIFRHGETDWNKERRLQGNTDIPLNETGRTQALRLRRFFAENPVEVFLSSDLARAKETALIAAGDQKVEIITDRRLRETHLGEAEGLTQSELIQRFGADAWDAWYSTIGIGEGDFRFPGGESKSEHLARVLDGLESFLRSSPYTRIGVASHGGVVRRLIHHFRPELTTPVLISNCVVYELTFEIGKGLWHVDLEAKCTTD